MELRELYIQKWAEDNSCSGAVALCRAAAAIAAMDVTAVLLNAQSPDANLRQAAEQQLEQAKMTNL
eukprot:3084655-Pleurochrysis_carterae.AAC.3